MPEPVAAPSPAPAAPASAPAAPAAAAPPAPTTGVATPPASVTPESKPLSLRDRLEAADKAQQEGQPPSSPQPAGAVAQPPGAATTQPPASGVVPGEGDKRGPVPLEVHEKSIQNARAKGADEALKPYAWVPKGTNMEELEHAWKQWRQLMANPSAFVKQLQGEIANSGDAPINPIGWSEDGKQSFYSAEQTSQIVQREVAKAVNGLRGELNPLFETREQQAEATRVHQAKMADRALVMDALTEIRQHPMAPKDLDENPAFLGAFKDPRVREIADKRGPDAGVHAAFRIYLANTLGQRQVQTERDVADKLKADALASSGGVNPSGTQAPSGAKGLPANATKNQLAKALENNFNAAAG